MLKNLKDNAKNLAANAKIEDMSRLFKNHMAGKQDVKNALSGVMVSAQSAILYQFKYLTCAVMFNVTKLMEFQAYITLIFTYRCQK